MLRVKLLRLEYGLSQFEVARDIDISQGRYSMIERGLVDPTQEERERIAQVLKAPVSTLLRPAFRKRTDKVSAVCTAG